MNLFKINSNVKKDTSKELYELTNSSKTLLFILFWEFNLHKLWSYKVHDDDDNVPTPSFLLQQQQQQQQLLLLQCEHG